MTTPTEETRMGKVFVTAKGAHGMPRILFTRTHHEEGGRPISAHACNLLTKAGKWQGDIMTMPLGDISRWQAPARSLLIVLFEHWALWRYLQDEPFADSVDAVDENVVHEALENAITPSMTHDPDLAFTFSEPVVDEVPNPAILLRACRDLDGLNETDLQILGLHLALNLDPGELGAELFLYDDNDLLITAGRRAA